MADVPDNTTPPGSPFRLGAWQPLTGGGVAASADSPTGRLLTFHLLTAALCAAAVVFTIRIAWVPALDRAHAALPESAVIQAGQLAWPDSEARHLGDSATLSIAVNPTGRGDLGQTSDLQMELLPRELRIRGLAGYAAVPYARIGTAPFPLGRAEALARWGAWRWFLVGLLGAAVGLALLPVWWLLAAVYAVPAWLIGFVFRQGLGFGGAWRLSGAALIPGALVACGSLAAYAVGAIRLTGLAAGFALHFVVPWIWLVWALLARPARPATARRKSGSPFAADQAGEKAEARADRGRPRRKSNPFRD